MREKFINWKEEKVLVLLECNIFRMVSFELGSCVLVGLLMGV